MPSESKTPSVTVARPFGDVYAFLADWNNPARRASGIGSIEEQISPRELRVRSLSGDAAVVRGCPDNGFGVVDHVVHSDNGTEIYVPMRVVRNGEGADVMITLFRSPGMSEAQYSADERLMLEDIRSLKMCLES